MRVVVEFRREFNVQARPSPQRHSSAELEGRAALGNHVPTAGHHLGLLVGLVQDPRRSENATMDGDEIRSDSDAERGL